MTISMKRSCLLPVVIQLPQTALPPQPHLSPLPLLLQFPRTPLLLYPKEPPRHPKYPLLLPISVLTPMLTLKITCDHLPAFQIGTRLAAWSPSSTSTIFILLWLQVGSRLTLTLKWEIVESIFSTNNFRSIKKLIFRWDKSTLCAGIGPSSLHLAP